MRLLFELSMECESLARAEALSVGRALGTCESVMDPPGLMVAEAEADPLAMADRVSLCHFISEHLGSCDVSDIESLAEELDVDGPVRVHATRIGTFHVDTDLEAVNRRIGEILGRSSGVDIHSPASEVRIVFSDRAHFGRRLAAVDRASYEARKTRNLPFDYPISLHPKFARCLVNLTRVNAGDSLLDPFCGTGAIVAEASLVGAEVFGTDVSEKMIAGAQSNLASLGLEADLRVCDVGSIPSELSRIDRIATDPPYGRSTSTLGEPIPRLLERAFAAFGELLDRGGRVALALHDRSLLSAIPDFRLVERHELRVHRSLTRHFLVAERV
ncbi:MAG: methyltransferase domain-containing protein [Methanobacteriota archaeon]|nr:MAG: methyltransferase domain-containing protein [Euryarchaeota archaeon]